MMDTELKTVVVAGCTSGAGKTSVAESVTRMLAPLCRVAAAKITVTHGDRGCPHGGKGCNVCSSLGADYQVITSDFVISQPGTDTQRLQTAGGKPTIWIVTREDALASAWLATQELMIGVECVVVESNSLTGLIEPSLTIMIADPSVSRKLWKPSAERLIASADCLVFNDRGTTRARDALLREIELLRGKGNNLIRVSHPHDVEGSAELMHNLNLACCVPIA